MNISIYVIIYISDIYIYIYIYIYQKIQDSGEPKLRGNFIVIHLNEVKKENQLDRELEKIQY